MMERISPIANVINECIDYHIKVKPISTNFLYKPPYQKVDAFSKNFVYEMYGISNWVNHDIMFVATDLKYPPMKNIENHLAEERSISCFHSNKYVNKYHKGPKFITINALTTGDICPHVVVFANGMTSQELFRACSRATRYLHIVDDLRSDVNMIVRDEYLKNDNPRASRLENKKKEAHYNIPLRRYHIIQNPTEMIKLPNNMKNQQVADINGLAIPMLYEYRTTGKIAAIDIIKSSKNIHKNCIKFIENASFDNYKNILKLSNIYLSVVSGYKSKLFDINVTEYEWLTPEVIDVLMKRMAKYVSDAAEYEVELGNFHVDAIDNNIIWEFKCKNKLTSRDMDQLSKYAEADGNIRRYRLFNILTEEIIELI